MRRRSLCAQQGSAEIIAVASTDCLCPSLTPQCTHTPSPTQHTLCRTRTRTRAPLSTPPPRSHTRAHPFRSSSSMFNKHQRQQPAEPPPPPPKELYLDEKWDKLLDLSLRRLVYGSLAGGLAALVLMRGPSTRLATVAFGAGFGAGSAWQACAEDFETTSAAAAAAKRTKS